VKVQCDLCREIVALADFTPSAEGIQIRCPACGGTYFVPAPGRGERKPAPPRAAPVEASSAPPAEAAAGAADEVPCPKCGRRQPTTAACRYCGLVFALWDPESAAAAASAGDDTARQLFAFAEEAWGEPARHDAVVEYCTRAGQLPFAARAYRERLARDPDDAVATARLQRVAAVAELTCLTRPRELAEAPVPYRGVLVAGVIALFLVLLGMLTSPLWRWWK
jgi:hypothetical protein